MRSSHILRHKLDQFKLNTYTVSTNNPMRRLRQHNEEIKGVAKATHGNARAWEICAMLSGFPDHINALSCEWRMKCPSGRPGKREAKYQRVQGRVSSLNEILPLERWTGKCIVDNCDFKFKLHILTDVMGYLDKTNVPENMEIVEVDTIDASCIDLEKELHD